ncbi:MAG: nitric oxide synthase [Alphaproteobacteria bacterium]|nr:nitric oxide synthase [Alphaproteobacteria bacterium]
MTQSITILVGTMTGTAELVAEEIKAALAARGAAVEVLAMDKLTPAVFGRPGRFVICTSTYGQGDVPDNAQALFAALESGRPDLSRIEYGVVGLGDMTYAETFCEGGKKFDRLLAGLGAKRLGERLDHNASGAGLPEDDGRAWAETWPGGG